MSWSLIWLAVLIFHLLFIYFLLSLKKKEYPEFKKPFTVIIPCYNEEPAYLKKCVESILSALGKKQVILVDDGSNKAETLACLKSFKTFTNLTIIRQSNKGKRYAHETGLKKAKYKYIIFVDSDTIVEKNAFLELIKPFNNENIWAVSGNVKLANRNQNLLTKMIATLYWNSFNIIRKATTNAHFINVCPGALSAYRRDYLDKVMPYYIKQKFYGRKCSISDDRYLTARIIMVHNKKIAFQEKAVCYTYSPHTFKGFFKQLIRWSKGNIRETILLFKAPGKFKKIKYLYFSFFCLLALLVSLFLKMSLAVFLILSIIRLDLAGILFSILIIFSWLIIFSLLYSTYMFFEKEGRKQIFYRVLYSFVYEFLFFFSLVPAIIGVRNQGKWATR